MVPLLLSLILPLTVGAGPGEEGPVGGKPSGAGGGRLEDRLFPGRLDVEPRPVSADPSVKLDYDIVYVRARRAGDQVHKRFYTDIAAPVFLEPGADLMLLHPDGSEELLVEGGEGAVTDPMVSLDGEWVYYTLIHTLLEAGQWQPPSRGADIEKIHVRTRRIVRLTRQEFTPNTGAADWSSDCRKPGEGKTHLSYGVLNFGPCPLPGGRVAFTSNRNAFRPPRGYPTVALQLFVMDDDGRNVEQIGFLNIAGALHPVVLTDGRILFSSLESQGARSDILWGIWTIHPDGTNWAPVVSAFDPGGAPNAFHFQTQLSDGSLVIEEYYNQNNSGFGAYLKLPLRPPPGEPGFGPARMGDPRHRPLRFGRHENGKGRWYRMPFLPAGAESLTPFSKNDEGPADPALPGERDSPRVGKFTHPSGAPDNHLLTVWSPGPVNHQYTFLPQLDGGIYLLLDGRPIEEPGQLLLVKNDPRYNEGWPRALVPYRRIYGIDEPARLPPLENDGRLSPHLPEGTPFALVGTSSLYKRESYPDGAVPEGRVTAAYAGGNDPWRGLDAFSSHGNGMPLNWHNQGAEAGLYSNADIHAIRILVMEPTTDRNRGPRSGRLFHSHAQERLRILGEIPVRKLGGGEEPLDPDGNPDTSFLARIPADTAFTFQTLDRQGMVLNMAQTWHQLRPGEVRHNCGGCHAHSQKPTPFEKTAAARPDYPVWDLASRTPLLTTRVGDQSGKSWDRDGETGVRFQSGVLNVEYFRDVKPILERSCVPCHAGKTGRPAGNLALDSDDEPVEVAHRGKFPGAYYRLAMDEPARFGHKPAGWDSWGYPQASRYVRRFQSRRSLLIWKVFGRRLDGFSNDDHPSETEPGSGTLAFRGKPVDLERHRSRADLDYTGGPMPPPEAVEGSYEGPDGKRVRVPPLGDEDRFTLVRWVDLGCPIDLDHDPREPSRRGWGWMCDDNRPTLTLATPRAGRRPSLSRLLVGAHDYGSGLVPGSLTVRADFPLNGRPAGTDLAPLLEPLTRGVWELPLERPITALPEGRILVSVKDAQGNIAGIDRLISIGGDREEGGAPASGGEVPGGLVERGALPERVHVFEDYETEIEKRWWLRGEREEQDRLACRATETKDFDDLMGDPAKRYRAVVFNPVPGPPMGKRARLGFRYRLKGADSIRVQIYSLTRNYHRRLVLTGLSQGSWQEATVDMTRARRPDGSGGPLSEDERIDDIQFYVEPEAELSIDDIVLYEAAPEGETRPFPRRVIFTGWFDTGKQGAEWPGDFEIVAHETPRTWKAARSVAGPEAGPPWIRVHLRGRRPLGASNRLRFRYRLSGAPELRIALRDTSTGEEWAAAPGGLRTGEWAEVEVDFPVAGPGRSADEVRFIAIRGSELLIDDLLLYEPAAREVAAKEMQGSPAAGWSDLVPRVAGSKELFVGPEGKPGNPGTRAAPWDLASALSGARGAAPGDVIWVRGGVYRGKFEVKVAGKEGAPVHVRAFPGERATVLDSGLAVVEPASHVWIWDLEIAGSTPREKRETGKTGSHPDDLPGTGGLSIHAGKGCKFLNLYIHDNVRGGVDWWVGSTDSEVHGCLILENGWRAPDRGHGHSIYTQNRDGVKTVSGCIMSVPHDGSYTLHAYGSSRAYVDNYHLEDNVAYGRGPFLVGGGRPSRGIRVLRNRLHGVPMRIGYGARNEDCEVRENVIARGSLSIEKFERVVEEGNRKGLPDREAFLIPNRYDPHRAHIVIYNGAGARSVSVPAAPFLRPGDRYRLMDPRDFHGKPVLEGQCEGPEITVPLEGEFAVLVALKT